MRINHITKLSIIFVTFLFVLILSSTLQEAWGSCRIQNISLKKEGNFTQVCVYADQPFEFVHSTEEAKDGKPYRVIIDCKDAIFDLPQHNYREGLPPGTIKAIRTSQFQAVPERIVRVVLDLKGSVVYKLAERKTKTEACIAILTTKDPDFSMWVAVLDEDKDQKKAMGKKQREGALLAETVSQKEKKSEQPQASLLSAESSPELTAAEKQKAEFTQKEKIHRRAVCYADTGESALSIEEKSVLWPKTEAEDKDIKKGKEISRIIKKRALPSEQDISPQVSSVPTKSLSDQVTTKGIKEDKTERDISSSSARVVLKPASKTKAEKQESSTVSLPKTERISSKQTSRKRQISLSPVPLGPFPEEQSLLAETSEEKKTKKVEGEKKEDVSTSIPGSAEAIIEGILGPEPAAARETQTLAESLMIIQSTGESELGLVPQRKMVFYNPETRRDPFSPTTEREGMSFGEAPIPLFENLKLVGILKDKEGNRALMENEIGFGYILMSGDKIKNGYVISVEDDKAIFHVEQYGGYQIMVLELNREY